MIIDTAAIIAILRDEPEGPRFSEAIEAAPRPKMSAVSYVEAGIVADAARNPAISRPFDELIRIADIEIRPVTPEQARLAWEAYRDSGRGSGHPARLNFGDCFAYALAKEAGEPLLFQGDDFLATDLIAAD